MKKGLIVFLSIVLVLLSALYFHTTGVDSNSKRYEDEQTTPPILPGMILPEEQKEEASSKQPITDVAKKSNLYDPSIFVIEASGSWRQELTQGYYANYQCELYLDKFDANDNRSAAGLYTGVFWLKVSMDVADYLKELLKHVPVEMNFAAGGEGICDNLTMHLLDGYGRDPFGDFSTPAINGGNMEPAKEALAGEGGFIAVGKQTYLNIRARGAAGEELSHQDGQIGDTEIHYVIQIEPDPAHTAVERKVTIYLSNNEGMGGTIEGVWRRLPGYGDDMLEYANSGKSAELLEQHLQ